MLALYAEKSEDVTLCDNQDHDIEGKQWHGQGGECQGQCASEVGESEHLITGNEDYTKDPGSGTACWNARSIHEGSA